MFQKLKNKLAEEMKQSPARLQASMQQLAQAVVSPSLSNSSIQELSTSNDNFSLTEEGDETPKNSPVKHGFQNVDLISPTSNSMGISRRSSISSVTSDTSALFPIYESPANMYHLQSDMDQSASEIDENISSQLDKVTKDQIYSAYRKVQTKYHKYRGRYTDLATHYRELERVKGKLESVLVESQDKALRRIADLREQCQLEQQAKAHLEEALRNDIEEKDHIINTLNTKIKLLQTNGSNLEGATSNTNDEKENLKDNLIDLSTESSNALNENTLALENAQLKDKLKKLENVVLKWKDSLKRNKEKFMEVSTEKNTLESDYETLKNSYAEKEKELSNVYIEVKELTDQVNILKKREEESAISLAENKLFIHRELEDKEERIKQLRLDLKHMTESKDSLSEIINKYKTEVEKLKLLHSSQNSDPEKKEVVQDISRGKSEALKLMQEEMQQKLIKLEDKIGLRYHEDIDGNKEHLKNLEVAEKENTLEKKLKVSHSEVLEDLRSKLDKKENELQEMKGRFEELQKLTEEYQNEKERLFTELSSCKVYCKELKNEQDAQKIIADDITKQAQIKIKNQQTIIQTRDEELKNLREILMNKDKDENSELNKLNEELENKNTELLGVYNELKSCKSSISDLKNKLQTDCSNAELFHKEKSILIKNILNYKGTLQKLKEDGVCIKSTLIERYTHFNDEISVLKNVLTTYIERNNAIQNDEMENIQIKMQELSELRGKHDDLQTELRDILSLKCSLEADLEKCKEQLKEMSLVLEQRNELELKNSKLVAEMNKLQCKLNHFENLSEELNFTNQSLSNEVSDLKEHLQKAINDVKEFDNLKANYIEATETIALLKSENSKCNKLEDEAKALQSEIQNLKDSLIEKDKDINTFSETLETKENVIQNLKTENENNVKLFEEREKEIIELTDKRKGLQKTLQTKLAQLKKLKSIKEEQDTTIQQLNDEINEMKIKNTKLLDELNALEKVTDELKSENCQITKLKDNNSTISTELEQLKLIQNEINLENKNLKDKQNEFLKLNQELNESNEKMKETILSYKKHNQQLLNDNTQSQKEIELYKSNLNEQTKEIENLKTQITVLNTKLQSKTKELQSQIEELIQYKKETEEIKERIIRENETLQNEMFELSLILKSRDNIEEENKELLKTIESLKEKLLALTSVEEENNKLKLDLNNLNKEKDSLEDVQIQNNELVKAQLSLKEKITELENVESVNTKLQSYVNNLESKISNLQEIQSRNVELQTEFDTLKITNVELLSEIKNMNVDKGKLVTELDELKFVVDEKVAELKLLDTKNTELLREIERLKSSMTEEESTELELSRRTIEHLKGEIAKIQAETEILLESNTALQKEMQSVHNVKVVDESLIEKSNMLQEEKKKLEAQLDEVLITFQAKESQMQIVNNDLKNQADKLREELKTNEEEQSMRIKQLVKEFQAQLQDKEEELHAALEKRFDRQQNYESNLIHQYKEQLKDFQVELTAKSEQIENLILENKNLMSQKSKDINQVMEKISLMKKEHADEVKEIEKKWKAIMQQKTDMLEAKHEEEISELTKEWQNERRELESTSRVAMAAVQSNTGSFHTLQQTLTAQRRELAELRKIVKLRHDTLEDSTEIEYLRNILFEYMMGRETMVLARVIAAVVKFDQEQTAKILKKEEDKMTLLGSLGLT
ncbi:uncharacterized protein LOC116435054 isoform X2 [Nomia melanderi]|uniref:uncharacterized protein LOC116435054 isoform X2 n=1 Tax=Nomia melanderi TaxID=2448451 RepID=UPI0013045A25|nr:golgin subfamily A member 4 isoform X2 [Nomia melanderi]